MINMSIEKYIVTITDLHTLQLIEAVFEGNSAIEVHKKALSAVNNLNEEITTIENSENVVVYSLKDGFLE